MPVIIGPAEILNVSGGIVHFGDSAFITPKESAKTFGGSGGFNTGDFVIANNGLSGTNIVDSSIVDQPLAADN